MLHGTQNNVARALLLCPSLTTLTKTHNIIAVVSNISPTRVEPIATRVMLVTTRWVSEYIWKVHTQKNSATKVVQEVVTSPVVRAIGIGAGAGKAFSRWRSKK